MLIKKILGLTVALLLLAGIASIGTWAYFTDTATSSNNVLLAGTLDLSPVTDGAGPAGKYTVTAGGNNVNGKVVFQKLYPGESGNITWVLTDTGSLPGTLTLISSVTFNENGSNEIESAVPGNNCDGNGDLDTYMGVKLQRGVGINQAGASANLTYLLGSPSCYATFSSLQAALNSAGTAIAGDNSNDTVVYKLSWELGSLFCGVNQNIIQSDSAQIDITFDLNQ
jgi:predicted ribosomally synthesized peptide with SipW-like signal peptide